MSKLVILRGLPASGKSTYAAQLVMQQGYKRVSADDLRRMLSNGIYDRKTEHLIGETMESLVTNALLEGYNVVLDNPHLKAHQVGWALNLALAAKAEASVMVMNISLDECIKRDLARTSGRVGKDLIVKMYNEHFNNGILETYDEIPVRTLFYNN